VEEREEVLDGESKRLCLDVEDVGVVGLGGELIHPVGETGPFVTVDGVREGRATEALDCRGVGGTILRGGVESGNSSRGREIVGRYEDGGGSSCLGEERMESPFLSFFVRVRASGIFVGNVWGMRIERLPADED